MSGQRLPQAKNRAPAPVQITAEQILREASDRQLPEAPKIQMRVMNEEELEDFRAVKRKEFETMLRTKIHKLGVWLRYAQFEESQKCFERARSVFERALDFDYTQDSLWRKYAEMEMRNKFINHARNVWDRAVTYLPRVDQLWLRYAYMEEMAGSVPGARAVFERWTKWEPDHHGWMAYIKLEVRAGQMHRARELFERYVACHPTQEAYLRYAKWEERQLQHALARNVYERAVEELPQEEHDEAFWMAFARFEERCREHERARCIFKHALSLLDEAAAPLLHAEYVSFEKKHGDKVELEGVILDKRRAQYEQELEKDPRNYDIWFDFVRLEESAGDPRRVREVYERAVANVPPREEKRFWKRYIYLWIYYALFEELEAKDAERTRAVYKTALKVVPHKALTFAKLWVVYAHFEVRQKNLAAARKALGTAIGMCPREKLFEAYIELELQLGEVDRCRTLYARMLETWPDHGAAWRKFAELEASVGEVERARAVYELAVAQPALDTPETLWKAYIDFEIENQEQERTRQLYERLLEKTAHVKVFTSYAQFEASVGASENARDVYQRADAELKGQGLREERAMLLTAWREFEEEQGEGNEANLATVRQRMPRRVMKKRMVQQDEGGEPEWEEYEDLIFPDDEKAKKTLSLLERAAMWKRKRAAQDMTGGRGGNEPATKRGVSQEEQDEAEIDLDDM